MENTTESRETFAASNPTPQGQDGSSLNAAFDVDAFVHASGDGFGNTAPLRSDTGAIDMDAISQVAHVTQGAGKLTRKEKKHAKREMKRRKKEAKKAEKEAKKTYSSIKSQLKDRDKELSDKMADARKKRDSAKDVVNYIGYNKMYQDGICEVEEGMFSSSIAFDDTSYHSVRDEQQKAMFSAITRLYDQFGADTLVQMSVINTPLLKEEVGHRKFFDPERQANDAARNDAQVFNNILNDKVKEGVSNIRRNRYLTYSVTADTAEDAARQLSRIEVESSRILNSIGTLPAVKDIVFLVVTYCILSYFIDNALDLVSAIYGIFNDLVGNVSDKLQSKNWYEPGIKMTKDDAADATFGGCFLLLIFGLISWAVGLVFYAVSMVVALGRSVQLYVYAAFSPIPISLLGFEETKQIGIGYLKNFAAAALAGVVMVLILYLYPHLVTALAVSGGLGKAEMLGLAQGVETFDSFGVIIKTIAVLITTMMGLVKSGSWAKEILGA